MKGIVLIGFMGAGKTTIGRLLAERLQLAHVDFDDLIVESIGMTIQDYFDRYGEAAFREKETEILTHSLTLDQVISTGGGIILKEENRQLLQQFPKVVYLKTEPEELLDRLKNDTVNIRPLVVSKSPAEIIDIYRPRMPLYEESATVVIDTTRKSPAEIVTEIIQKAGE
ncbi:shikimate kinase [Enterococcus gallinarum]|uniref:shikimate kinase n=1 Tax=Enterococcus gallinarum TaxID=1353 RepID=UPI00288C72FC|nr:shikimate kinase [Enterococcus gallinarum]MDT2700844.1 shikimate kinase [Enterococcus gallinarum]